MTDSGGPGSKECWRATEQFSKNFETVGPLSYEDQFLQVHLRLSSTFLYGLGEGMHSSFLHSFHNRTTSPLFARDQLTYEGDQNEYGVHPYYMVLEDDLGTSHSVLLYNSNAMEYSTFLLNDGTPGLTLRTIGGVLDFHILMGPKPDHLIAQYTNLVGRPLLPPYWSLGFGLSRWGYNSTQHVREVVARNKAANIPQDVQTLDIDYMQNKRDFTIDSNETWSDLPNLVQELHNDGVKVILIFDPAIATDLTSYPPAMHGRDSDVFVKWLSSDLVPDDQCDGCGDYLVGRVWPGDTFYPDFFNPQTQQWWTKEVADFHKVVGFDGMWVDMNEPSSFGTNVYSIMCPQNQWDDPPYPTKAAHIVDNVSKRLRALEALFPGRRPFVLSRSTFPGSGRYTIHWLGDNFSTWKQMRLSVIGMLEFNLFGIPMVGADICGFSGHPHQELCTRWTQLGAFYSFSRNHNMQGWADQDPAVWPQVAQVARDVLALRYQYLPYLYTLLYLAHTEGGGVVRPLLNQFPGDMTARGVDDQFMWGSGIMVAPVLEEGATEREVYFPQGAWYDLVTGAPVVTGGPTNSRVQAPLEVLPLYVLGGVVLPFQHPALTTTQSRRNGLGVTVAPDEAGEACGLLFWDDGESQLDHNNNNNNNNTFLMHFNFTQNELTGEVLQTSTVVDDLKLQTVQLLGVSQSPQGVTVNGVALSQDLWVYDSLGGVLLATTDLPLGERFTVRVDY
ncbi:hypothetical protein Pcinc_014524 [Petrolisthes cinctipes]|uniref:Uncharacterized protein n=1 Tax=Petrolisthes cinctipes TaxID=88211 RepID=A0AAE1FUW1_PETCI|nr:hypothetical protein Pcinc_014524 [Petrolisthes cinctipes]